MKTSSILLSLLCMIMLYSCGGNTSNSNQASSTSPLSQNGISSSPAGVFEGIWSGYLDATYTVITIAANGGVTIAQNNGQPSMQRLLVKQGNQYLIANPQTHYAVAVRVSGTTLLLAFSNGEQTLNKN